MSGVMGGAFIALFVAFMTFMLRSMGYEGAKLISVVGTVSLLCALILGVGRLMESLPKELLSGRVVEVAEVALRIMGVGYVFGIVADICRELGETGLANTALGLGRVEILMLSMPYISEVVSSAVKMLEI